MSSDPPGQSPAPRRSSRSSRKARAAGWSWIPSTPRRTDIEGFDRLWLIYWLDRVGPYRPLVTPYLDDRAHGVLATRSPTRPNPIGLSVVRLVERRGCTLEVADLDVLDQTPLLDVKPYVPRFDAWQGRAGWVDGAPDATTRDDGRFESEPGSQP